MNAWAFYVGETGDLQMISQHVPRVRHESSVR